MEKESMKKVSLVLISVALILSLSGSVLAGTVGTSGSIVADQDDLVSGGLIKADPLSSSVYVKYAVSSESYTVKIPGAVTLNGKGDSVDSCSVEVTQVTLVQGRYLNISVVSAHSWNLVFHEDSETPIHAYAIPYSMKYDAYTWSSGSAVGEATDGSTNTGQSIYSSPAIILLQVHGNSEDEHMSNDLIFTMDGDAPTVGEYYDKLTFTVSVEGNANG